MLTVSLSEFLRLSLAGAFVDQNARVGSAMPPTLVASMFRLVWHGMSAFVVFDILSLPFYFICWYYY
jgi:hypothetical protein